MSYARLVFLLVSPAVGAVVGLSADGETTSTRGPAAPTVQAINAPAVPATEEPSSRARAVSPAVAAQLVAATPKFEPVIAPKVAEPMVDLREVDRPRNTILRLPNYIVREQKPPVFKDRDLLTPKARRELALKKFPGLRLGSFWIFSNDGIAAAMLAEEERLEQKRELEGMAELMRFTDPAAHETLKGEVKRAFLRPADFGR